MKNIKKLLHDYGYPEATISNLMKELGTMSYEQVEKQIMPYQDITADTFQNEKTIHFNERGF